MRKIIIMAWLATIALPGQAATASPSQLLNFELKPSVCIAREVGDTCQMNVKLKWQLDSPSHLCLKQNDAVIKCWQQQQVEETLAIKLQQQSEFLLFDKDSDAVLIKREIKINYQINQRYRRRLRSEWSIF